MPVLPSRLPLSKLPALRPYLVRHAWLKLRLAQCQLWLSFILYEGVCSLRTNPQIPSTSLSRIATLNTYRRWTVQLLEKTPGSAERMFLLCCFLHSNIHRIAIRFMFLFSRVSYLEACG